ncbi:tripartite ATP-independent periplasmic transporters, DctQ component [Variibacter gotjawalensis]|uniref:TRAP transporter small permease protein n=1 Tax=Variibacter gotjawalensis TaxID=1333996 RepID=A0A0S3PVF4_9BRAD|nr:TRAP transporter small permease [Variibacter gotjawalensis]NIK45742.1 TRAP-type C4-dicarboxylate transport system permease small subunit [Variibacter gotjawalensis]RZS47666.1 TRAP-type C4-dicarboxylate transport system permease small subunit [Variibacter gotjawalensis]BAT59919.1 tripartite ATP-independent periplasmic transporters, DctQ component [Variibacter gotjawalensis]
MLRTFLDRLYLLSGYLAGLFVVAIFVLMMLLSAGRPLGFNIPAGDELIAWCMAATAFLGLAHTFRSGEMIRVGLLIDRFKGRTRWWFDVLSLVIGVGFVGFFTYYAVMMTYDSYRFNDMAQGVLAIPMWIPQLGYSGGLVILTIAFIDEFFYVITGKSTRFDKPPPQTAEEAIERAMQSAV